MKYTPFIAKQARLFSNLSVYEVAEFFEMSVHRVEEWEKESVDMNKHVWADFCELIKYTVTPKHFEMLEAWLDSGKVATIKKSFERLYVLSKKRKRPFLGNDVAIFIRSTRKSFGLTQKEFSEKLGCATITVSNWETGVSYPKKEYLDKIIGMAK
jgi:DNA-binding transcriptional regulator YiaG